MTDSENDSDEETTITVLKTDGDEDDTEHCSKNTKTTKLGRKKKSDLECVDPYSYEKSLNCTSETFKLAAEYPFRIIAKFDKYNDCKDATSLGTIHIQDTNKNVKIVKDQTYKGEIIRTLHCIYNIFEHTFGYVINYKMKNKQLSAEFPNLYNYVVPIIVSSRTGELIAVSDFGWKKNGGTNFWNSTSLCPFTKLAKKCIDTNNVEKFQELDYLCPNKIVFPTELRSLKKKKYNDVAAAKKIWLGLLQQFNDFPLGKKKRKTPTKRTRPESSNGAEESDTEEPPKKKPGRPGNNAKKKELAQADTAQALALAQKYEQSIEDLNTKNAQNLQKIQKLQEIIQEKDNEIGFLKQNIEILTEEQKRMIEQFCSNPDVRIDDDFYPSGSSYGPSSYGSIDKSDELHPENINNHFAKFPSLVVPS